jgi:hypothetical protein
MARLRILCISARPYLREGTGEALEVGSFEGAMMGVTLGREYEVLAIENGWYRIVDDSGEDYLYPPHMFQELRSR